MAKLTLSQLEKIIYSRQLIYCGVKWMPPSLRNIFLVCFFLKRLSDQFEVEQQKVKEKWEKEGFFERRN